MDKETSTGATSQSDPIPQQLVQPSLTLFERNKAAAILQACRIHDLEALISLATSESGLVEDEVRQTACTCCREACRCEKTLTSIQSGPLLLGYSYEKLGQPAVNEDWRRLPRHKDEDQVALDVDRSFIYYPKSKLSSPVSEVSSK